MRVLVGLDAPTSGATRVNGKPYRGHRAPLREIGVLLEARAVHPGRSAWDSGSASPWRCSATRTR